jgi:ABC-type lipoprotein release transport system permease subunit
VDFADMVMRSYLNPVKWTLATIGVALVSVASALYPAWKAAHLAPAEAMRFYE